MADRGVAELVALARAGDEAAWRELVALYLDLVWSVARAHSLDRCDAADVTQTTWLRLAEHLDRLREPSKVGAWLATTARRESLKVLRERRRQVPSALIGELADRSGHLTAAVIPGESLGEGGLGGHDQVLAEAFAALAPPCQSLLRALMADPAPSYSEVSAALGMPMGSIGPTRARCLDRLRANVLSLSKARDLAASEAESARQTVNGGGQPRTREVS